VLAGWERGAGAVQCALENPPAMAFCGAGGTGDAPIHSQLLSP
jgi:hypothetical protein